MNHYGKAEVMGVLQQMVVLLKLIAKNINRDAYTHPFFMHSPQNVKKRQN